MPLVVTLHVDSWTGMERRTQKVALVSRRISTGFPSISRVTWGSGFPIDSWLWGATVKGPGLHQLLSGILVIWALTNRVPQVHSDFSDCHHLRGMACWGVTSVVSSGGSLFSSGLTSHISSIWCQDLRNSGLIQDVRPRLRPQSFFLSLLSCFLLSSWSQLWYTRLAALKSSSRVSSRPTPSSEYLGLMQWQIYPLESSQPQGCQRR